MPNFHLHWLVAWKALDQVPGSAQAGRDSYQNAARGFGRGLSGALGKIDSQAEVEAFFSRELPKLRARWNDALLKTPETRDQVTCFSAYMLGACGPDFWTLPSRSGLGIIPDTAGEHFDLGHYNRTHQQFRVSIERIGNATGIQADVERSYFLGMATHVAADLVIHQLVNVFAGAYNLLKKRNWNAEHTKEAIDLWNTHNKVEHFWDSYVRYRFLGDLTTEESVFDDDASGWMDPLGFPLVETLVAKARKVKDEKVRQALLSRLLWRNPERHQGKRGGVGGEEVRNDVRVLLEAPLLFPALACDRILGNWPEGQPPLRPFIYDRVVHKKDGAYPQDAIFDAATSEADSAQMVDDRSKARAAKNEVQKLRYFSAAPNAKPEPDWATQTYVNYFVAPDLARLREIAHGLQYGRNAFYDLGALERFGDRAIAVAKSFASRLASAYNARNPDGIGDLARFWNLDTGLGFEVQNVASHSDREVVTRLDLLHVLDPRIAASCGPAADPGWRRGGAPGDSAYLAPKQPHPESFSRVEEAGFPVRAATEGSEPDGVARPFPSLAAVQEPDAKAYLDRLRIEGTPEARVRDLKPAKAPEQPTDSWSALAEKRTQAWLDAFFAREESPRSLRNPFGTVSESVKRTLALQTVKHRLTLELRIAVADVGGSGGSGSSPAEPAMLFYCDHALAVSKGATKAPRDWLSGKKPIAYATEPEGTGALRSFTARILVNFAEEGARVVTRGAWNNVVPYDPSKKFYGRNFAIATGRRFVLFPAGGGLFDPTTDLRYRPDVSPTEHVFLTIHPLVKTPAGVFDAFGKQEVTRDDFAEIRKISGLEWKKVVLCYQLDGGKAFQLARCFVDALDVPVARAKG